MSCNKRNSFLGVGQRGIRKCSCEWLGRNTHSPLTHILRFRHHCQPRTGKPALRPCSGKLALRAPLSPRRNPGRLHVSSPSLSAPRPAPLTASEALPPWAARPHGLQAVRTSCSAPRRPEERVLPAKGSASRVLIAPSAPPWQRRGPPQCGGGGPLLGAQGDGNGSQHGSLWKARGFTPRV